LAITDGWGDDAGDDWGDDAPAGDDDWGDDGGDDDGWGDSDGDNAGGDNDEAELPIEVRVENTFYEADGKLLVSFSLFLCV
jgi:hypothetical protein